MLQSATRLSSEHLPQRSSPSPLNRASQEDVPVETLIGWLVAAKKSLSSIHNVQQATTTLAQARSTIESTSILLAKSNYLRRSLNGQLKIVRAIQGELEGAAHIVKQEINAVFKELEDADRKLDADIHYLKQTGIEAAFKIPSDIPSTQPLEEQDEKHTLHDFVDGQPVETIKQSALAATGSVKSARDSIDASIRSLEDDIQQVNEALAAQRNVTASSTKSDLRVPSVSQKLRLLEKNAHEMAHGLESLVQHFDSCVNAIKHTEGGGAAIAKRLTADDLPEGVDVEAFQSPTASMSLVERIEMLQILQSDAAQVDEVVVDIQVRGAEMESLMIQLQDWQDASQIQYRDVVAAYRLLDTLGQQLPNHSNDITAFSAQWQQERLRIEECIGAMEQLCELYENFMNAYDGMIVEAARRKTVKKRMDKIVLDAQAQLDKLHADDLHERERFRDEQGEFLPRDIWHGLYVQPAQYAFVKENPEGLDSIPELPREVVSSALRRVKALHGLADS